jgi:succinate dehydrogenase hydrophobic anchor subunit
VRTREEKVVQKRRLGIRFWWELLQFAASGLLLLVLMVAGIFFVFSEGLPWLGSGFTDLVAGESSPASLVVLLIVSVAVIVLVSALVGFGAEIGRSFARRLSSKRK